MRKAASIFFFSLFFANVAGYYGLLMIARRQIENKLLSRIERKVESMSGSLIITVPLSLPYPITDMSTVDHNGYEFSYEDARYRVIRQRIYQNTLRIECIRVEEMEAIHSTISDFVRTFAGTDQRSGPGLKLTPFKDYVINMPFVIRNGAASHRELPLQMYINHYSFYFFSTHFRPPGIPLS